jgi:uncharacterized protein (TIGR04255 family)
MLVTKLPKILEREPLVDAVCEVRMEASAPLADVLPGILFHQLKEPSPSISRLPAAEIPQPVRAAQPAWQYAPTQRLDWGEYVISVGDRNVIISCKMPYPKWPSFKKNILEIADVIAGVGVAGNVERFSVKYVNLIEAPTIAAQIAKINLKIRIGGLEVNADHLDMKVHHVEGDTIHIVTVITGANGRMSDGREASGVVVDIDSIRNIQPMPFDTFARGLEPQIEKLRQSNKVRFFDCLKQETVNEMGPVYE